MAKAGATGAALGAFLVVGAVAPASAAPVQFPVDVVVHTVVGEVSAFEGNIPGCETGTVADISGGPHFTPWGGSFVGVKEFTCDSGAGGFDVRLKARFGEAGATGSWTIIDAWGAYEGVKGSGQLTGTLTELGIDDRYTGSAR
ncbi:hypothetical protein [Mycetocola sp. 2940]|uniref:hypothetical protein n=1 Tax=Mycetocola sp. 2940 TaxID=3156452 RepID=UPI003394C4F4